MIGLVATLFSVVAEALRLYREHKENLGLDKLPPEERAKVNAAIVAAVKATLPPSGAPATLPNPPGGPGT
jgi:hypothetical protein